jgi:L-asparaginase
MVLSSSEKGTLIALIVAAIASVAILVCMTMNDPKKERLVVNNKMRVIRAGGDVEENFRELLEDRKNLVGNFDISDIDPIDGVNVSPDDWNALVEEINVNYLKYDVFIVVHPHDTLPYTASALSFMLEGTRKPVIFTDGEVASALVMASGTKIPEVMVASYGRLLRGCKTVASSTAGFTSPNYPSLSSETALNVTDTLYTPKLMDGRVKVVVIKLFPGIDAKFVWRALAGEPHGVIFETYGVGRSPDNDEFLGMVSDLAKKGIIMVSVSQSEEVDFRMYNPNLHLMAAGVLDGGAMTTPAAYAKLCYLLGNVKDKQAIGELMEQNFRGEMAVMSRPMMMMAAAEQKRKK